MLKVSHFLILGFVAMTIVACNRSSLNVAVTSKDCRPIVHFMGETCIPRHPHRVVTLGVPEFGNAIALGVKPIATVVYFDQPPPYLAQYMQDIVTFGSNAQPNLEILLRLKPDLIIGSQFEVDYYDMFSQIAPTVLGEWDGYPSWKKHFDFVADVLGKTEEGRKVWRSYYERIQILKNSINNRLKDKEISFVHLCCGSIALDLSNSFSGSIIADVGLKRPFSQAKTIEGGVSYISEELLSYIDGDFLFVALEKDKDKDKLDKLINNPLWQKLQVVQQNQIYLVNYPTWRGGNPLAAHAVIDDLFKYLAKPQRP